MTVVELQSPPRLGVLYAKAAATGLTGGEDLPDLELVLRDVDLDRDHLAAYNRVCGFRLRDEVPATYLHVVAFPLAVQIMADRSFPYALPGLVHIANGITQRRAVAVGERPTVQVRAEDLRPHPKGTQFDVVSEARVGDEEVWTETSTYLKRGESGAGEGSATSVQAIDRDPHAAVWEVPAGTGRRYAAVSGDRNPIHLHPLAARLFGFPRQIAHGMWSAARCLAGLEGRIPDAVQIDVEFRKPLLLPSTVAFTSQRHGRGWRFALHRKDGEVAHLFGAATPV